LRAYRRLGSSIALASVHRRRSPTIHGSARCVGYAVDRPPPSRPGRILPANTRSCRVHEVMKVRPRPCSGDVVAVSPVASSTPSTSALPACWRSRMREIAPVIGAGLSGKPATTTNKTGRNRSGNASRLARRIPIRAAIDVVDVQKAASLPRQSECHNIANTSSEINRVLRRRPPTRCPVNATPDIVHAEQAIWVVVAQWIPAYIGKGIDPPLQPYGI
jgi:hypothetical protein